MRILKTTKDRDVNQSDASASLVDRIDEDLVKVIDGISTSHSRLVFSGIGKSEWIGMKGNKFIGITNRHMRLKEGMY